NMERFKDWFPKVMSISSANKLPHGEVNKTSVERVSLPLRGTQAIEIVVKESVPNRRFVTEGQLPPLLPRMEIDLAPVDGGTTLISWQMFSRSANPLVKALLLPFAKRIVQRRASVGVLRLKAMLEQPLT
ncbi:MAG: SRPBCC family protein, partial [Burkholderiaceae bacterium]